MLNRKWIACFLSVCMITLCYLPAISGHIHLSHKHKKEIAKKIAAALFLAHKKRLMLPVPMPVPIPIPIFKQYQPIIHDPYFFKHQIIMHKLGKLGHLGGIGGIGGIGGVGGFGGGIGGGIG